MSADQGRRRVYVTSEKWNKRARALQTASAIFITPASEATLYHNKRACVCCRKLRSLRARIFFFRRCLIRTSSIHQPRTGDEATRARYVVTEGVNSRRHHPSVASVLLFRPASNRRLIIVHQLTKTTTGEDLC